MNRSSESFSTVIPLIFSSFLFLIGSCATSKEWLVTPSYSEILIPELNVTVVSELGDTLVDQGHMKTRDAIVFNDDVEASTPTSLKTGGVNIFLGKGTYVAARQDETHTYYLPLDAKVRAITVLQQDIIETNSGSAGYAKSKIDGSLLPFSKILTIDWGTFNEGEPSYIEQTLQERHSSSFRQQLIYNGRVDNNVRFIYREFSNDMARGSFTQEIQYDFSESKTIGFKGVRIEIINASNTQIEYKVQSHFNR